MPNLSSLSFFFLSFVLLLFLVFKTRFKSSIGGETDLVHFRFYQPIKVSAIYLNLCEFQCFDFRITRVIVVREILIPMYNAALDNVIPTTSLSLAN